MQRGTTVQDASLPGRAGASQGGSGEGQESRLEGSSSCDEPVQLEHSDAVRWKRLIKGPPPPSPPSLPPPPDSILLSIPREKRRKRSRRRRQAAHTPPPLSVNAAKRSFQTKHLFLHN
ncbi:hypothetical protein E2C01_077644 [Portunus trituberculatus]|uniref:Uncharacterized protein n=1 Tax=Portunus trituberculatus TaxID=210409 RepID=A0A5B7IKU0_PORTR|nr:hypothetical protein [Portunus trituberculatus]